MFDLFRWTIYTVVIPLMPLLIVAAIAGQPDNAIPYERLLGGTEIFLLCLFVASTTYKDWCNDEAKVARLRVYECLSPLMEIWIIVIATLSVYVFVHVHLQDLGMPAKFLANTGIVFGLLTTAVCLTAQVLLAKGEKLKREMA